MDNGWSIAKDAAGFVGAVCLFVPWARDYWMRARLEKVKGIPTQLDLKRRLQQRRETWLAKPKRLDLLISLGGMGLIAISFGLSLLISLKVLAP
jgi:hypothetical protein